MALVLTSNKDYVGADLVTGFDAYRARVLADGGTIKNEGMLINAFLYLRKYGLGATKMFSMTSDNFGVKESNGNLVKLYNLFDPTGDATSTGTGFYPVQEQNGLFSFYSPGSVNNEFLITGTTNTPNLASFSVFVKSANTTSKSTPLTDSRVGSENSEGLRVSWNPTNAAYEIKSNGISGNVLGIPYANNIGASTSAAGLRVYQNGIVVGQDLDVLMPANLNYNHRIASTKLVGSVGAQGNFYLNIIATDLTIAQEVALSKFAANFI